MIVNPEYLKIAMYAKGAMKVVAREQIIISIMNGWEAGRVHTVLGVVGTAS